MSHLFSPSAGVFGFFGMPQNGSDMRHMIAIHPTFARQLANAEDVEVTKPCMHKVIRGATLTEYGR